MEQKRWINFLLTASLVMMVYLQLQLLFNPPPAPPEQAVVDQAEQVDDVAAEVDAEAQFDARFDNEASFGERESDSAADDPIGGPSGRDDAIAAEESDEAPTAMRPAPLRRIVLGSMDPDSPYRMAVHLTSRGASIERIELNNPRYQELENNTGYLGNLALTDDPRGGCRVNAVAAGSPAAKAIPSTATSEANAMGLRAPRFEKTDDGMMVLQSPGDRIVRLNNTDIANALSLEAARAQTRPGDTITLTVMRENLEGGEERLEFRATLVETPLSIIAPEYGFDADQEQPDPFSFLMTLGKVGDARVGLGDDEIRSMPSLRDTNWQMQATSDGEGVEFTYRLTEAELKTIGGNTSLELVKRYRLAAIDRTPEGDAGAGYGIAFEIEVRNLGGQKQRLAYQLDGPTGLTLEGWWYSNKVHPSSFTSAGARDIVWRKEGDKHDLITCAKITSNAMDDAKDPTTSLNESTEKTQMRYVGSDAQFFTVVLLPADASGQPTTNVIAKAQALPVGPLDERPKKRTNVTFRLTSQDVDLAGGESVKDEYIIFAGPKKEAVLARYGLEDCIVYGWFGVIAKPMLGILHFFHAIVFSWGLSIIMLTILVRGAMFPLGRKMALNAQKMQELAPEMKAIAEKYKNDLEKRSQAQRELFAKNKYNPFAGCLVMVFQLPIFVGLYRSLSVDIELRQAPFLPGISWCSNLAGPDFFWNWQRFMPGFIADPTGYLGPYLNILPIITVVLFLVQQQLFTPPPQDEQQEMQQKVMKFMMLFMGVLFHKVAAGLCVYFIASSLWGIAERKLLPKPKLAGIGESEEADSPSVEKKKLPFGWGGGTNGNGNGAEQAAEKRKQRKKRRK